MKIRSYLPCLALLASLPFTSAASAAELRELTWDDLVPDEAQFDDVFTRLEDDTLYELTLVAGVRDQVTEERIAKTYIANEALDGRPVRIPGYLLPLEFEGDKVREFLLVPYVGACIHTPPPPPNQIVHVRAEQAYATDGGLYTPVWVNGVMKVERGQANLDFVDGTSDIPTAYTLEASSVEPYE